MGYDSNGAPGSGLRIAAGDVSDGVLMPDVARDALADFDNLIELAWKVSFASGCPGETAEHPRVPVLIVFFKDADGVDEHVGLFRQFQDISQRVCARVVAAIANDDQDFLVPDALMHALMSLDNRIVERRLA